MRRAYITGTAGFIGFHLARLLLDQGWRVHGFDGMTDYYDITLKRRRHAILMQSPGFSATEARLEEAETLLADVAGFRPDVIIHLAAQAGVRYSLEAPRSYISANVEGTFNVLEAAREAAVQHLLVASTSSVYGANESMPFRETDKADTQVSLYAATKKAGEALSHSYAHLHGIPTTAFRFFTVYGPWGRPDMALFKFTRAILAGKPIDVYGHGKMFRDFTYVTDLVRAIALLIDAVPERPATPGDIAEGDSLSPVAPWRVVNIGNGEKVALGDFIEAVEAATGRKAQRNLMEMQKGDVEATWADNALLQRLTGYRPETRLPEGVRAFVEWYRDYYQI
ncbi:NAD-dependent epimerase/dehydratase family protein [Ostreiculturibacter nitratireducens]|uniref:NAD-dependent epimerase/dehydratase family protein n=1 Tax=Ostreiculturibacter nitratireducens TaxID=3075226 RepID=UPI0031B578B6